jgi:hypothetical protein
MPASLDLRSFPGYQLQPPSQKAYRNEHWKGPLLLKQEKLDQ